MTKVEINIEDAEKMLLALSLMSDAYYIKSTYNTGSMRFFFSEKKRQTYKNMKDAEEKLSKAITTATSDGVTND